MGVINLEIVVFIAIGVFLLIAIYENSYYTSSNFTTIKSELSGHVKNVNELNRYIHSLSNIYEEIMYQNNPGNKQLAIQSRHNYNSLNHQNNQSSKYIYNCSRVICNNARNQPFKYLCKYFNINEDEETLENLENVFNKFSSAIEGKKMLAKEMDEVKQFIKRNVPFLIRQKMNKFILKIGFEKTTLNYISYPVYTFKYVSPGGNRLTEFNIVLNLNNLEVFINYLSERIEYKKSIAGQRALMTAELRNKIKNRDNFTCQYCNLSIEDEPNLLLEIDHIIPISKGGLSIEDNLQVLCWKCNRSKGSKIE